MRTQEQAAPEALTMLSLYSGVGGMDLGAHYAGIQTVAMCEADPWNRSILKRHWPEVPIFESDEDITAAKGQCSKALQIDRVSFRELVDQGGVE